ncbi:hypothetical protein GW17_00059474 [Ensete ventricosum]|nr:hypothetical protein GW17_00059474 [Ensete ventricosum]
MPLKANLLRAATGVHQIREAESRCLAVRHRLLRSGLPPSSYISLLRLLDAELRSLSRLASSSLSLPLSSNVGYLESIARLLFHPSVRCVSRVSRPVPADAKDHPIHVDLVCTLHRRPAWFVVSDRNPVYLSWLGPKGLRARVERVIAAAHSAGALKPASVLFVFSRGVRDHVSDNLVDEFGAVEVGLLNDEEDVFEELEDGWIGVRWSGSSNSRVFEIKIALDDGRDAFHSLVGVDEREEVGGLDDGFGSLVSRIDVDSADVVNFDTTALIAMVSGISNGGCERLMKAQEAEMRARFKSNYEFVMAQVTSELEHPILPELSVAIAGKKGIICENPYRPVHTGPAADRYADRPLPGGTAKIGRRQSISAVCGRFKEKSTVGGRLRKKKERRRRGKEEEEEEEEKYLAPRSIEEEKGKKKKKKRRRSTSHRPSSDSARGSPASRRCPRCPSTVAACAALTPSLPALP